MAPVTLKASPETGMEMVTAAIRVAPVALKAIPETATAIPALRRTLKDSRMVTAALRVAPVTLRTIPETGMETATVSVL